MAALDTLAKDRFNELHGVRGSTFDRAELCAELTIPYLFREEGSSAQDDLSREYVQGYGAKLVNHLVGKFALSILPPSQPFYRLAPTQEAVDAIAQGDKEVERKIEETLAKKEEGVLRYINKSKFRGSLYPALRLAMVTGDSLIEKLDDGTFRVLSMHNYVIKRDAGGNILDLIIKETIDYDALPEDVQKQVKEEDKNEPVDLYTRVYLEEGKFMMYQESADVTISGSEQTLKKLTDKFISIRWYKVDGEDYGRGFVEDFLGTFIQLNKNMKVLDKSGAISSKTIFTLNPNGMTRYDDFVEAANGDVIIGVESDIGTVKVNKASDMQTTYSLTQDRKKELAEAFLMGSAAIRDAERVTAHEVQLVASELEASFGGIYTALAEDIQIPLVENAMSSLKIDGGDDIDVVITAGVEALGRNVELAKINNLIQELGLLGGIVGQEAVAKTVNVAAFTSAMVVNSGVAGKDFLFTQDAQDQTEIANKQEAISAKMVEEGAATAGKQAVEQVSQQ